MGKHMQGVLLFWVLLLLAPALDGAMITGTVYDLNLDVVDKAIVEINTSPWQRMVAINGTYQFSIEAGSYRLSATHPQNEEYRTSEAIMVPQTAESFVLDLFLFYELNETYEDPLDLGIEEDIDWGIGTAGMVAVLLVLVLLIVIIIVLYGAKGPRRKAAHAVPTIKTASLDERIQAQVLELLRTNGHLMTQKDIRKRIPYSEAKISLIIKSLEEKGIVTKQRQGLVNVLRLVNR